MFFSLVEPIRGRERQAAHEWAAGAYMQHQWLWRFFPSPAGTPRDFLFRRWDSEDMPRFYVVSKRAPQAHSDAWQVKTSEYAPKLVAGSRLRFSLRANPVIRTREGEKVCAHDVVMHAKRKMLRDRGLGRWKDWTDEDRPALYEVVREPCIAWLRAQGLRGGFALDEETCSAEGYQQHRLKEGQLMFSTVDLSGDLTVVDPTAFVSLLYQGMGKAKAFGCGLMLVRSAA